MRSLPLLAAVVVVAACAPAPTEGRAAPAPLLGKADSADSADHSCRVILRQVSDTAAGRLADFDVATVLAAPGALLVRSDGAGGWTSVDGLGITGAPGGFARYRVRLSDTATRLELVPYAALPGGGRLFDHNRHGGDLDNYALTAPFNLTDDGACLDQAQPRATLEFQAGFTTAQHGALVRGGHLTVTYDLSRLTTCRSTHNGARFWSLDGFVKLQPSGLVVTGTLVASNAGSDSAVPLEVDLPDGSESAELWFHNYTPGECDAWDSNFGQNYHFHVGGPTAKLGWAGDWGSSFARDCAQHTGVPEPAVIDEYVRERACSFVDAEVWVAGATDADHPEWVQAQVEWRKDAQPATTAWLDFVERVGNNARFRWSLPQELRNQSDWSIAGYRFRFSTDGNSWSYFGQDSGAPRTLQRAF